eukprot:TRINITY_DN16991_c0_g2_i2.p1 TRINITY_DN16991_c0_g2~~TRINITY_DN16991_c0_g2_i2.p1  ORF type:complete len:290 (-),score=65.74 TRINITY_DN16991_c0_g2_i2:62-931(-)
MFQKAAVTALAWRASDEETKKLRHIFSLLDRDGNGHITVQELRGAIESTGVEIPEDLVQLAVQADTDGGGTIEYTEFLAATCDKKKVIREEVVWEAFRIFDQDGSGTITKKELIKILTGSTSDKIRQMHGNKAVDNFVEEYDVSGDAVIDFEEFMEMLNNVKETFDVSGAADAARRRSTSVDQRASAANTRGGAGDKGGASARGAGSAVSADRVGDGRTRAAPSNTLFPRCLYCSCTQLIQQVPETLVADEPRKVVMKRKQSERSRSKAENSRRPSRSERSCSTKASAS